MILNYSPYRFLPSLKFPVQIGKRLKQFCETQEQREDIAAEFYLQVLFSLSLSYLEKHNVFSKVWKLTNQKVEELECVFTNEDKSFSELYTINFEEISTLVCASFIQQLFLLKTYCIFNTPREEPIIVKQVINEWLKNDLKTLDYLRSFQNEHKNTPQKIILSYYQEDSDGN